MQEEIKIYMVTSLDKQTTLEVSHEVFKLVCSLTAELKATKTSLGNLVDRMVNPPYNEQLANEVKSRTQYLEDRAKHYKGMLDAECKFTSVLLDKLDRVTREYRCND